MQTQYASPYNSGLSLPRDIKPGKGLRALTLLTIAGLTLVITRGLLTGNWWFFVMLTWNLFLAWFPLGVVLVLRDLRASGFRNRWLFLSTLLLWLICFPNAPYIITDLSHIKDVDRPLIWFDTMTLFLFAFTGLLIGLYSILLVHRMLKPALASWQIWGLLVISQFLSGFGIYLGRVGRWNSWDVLTNPASLALAIARSYQDHLSIKLTLAYGFVLIVLYLAFYWYAEHEENAA